MNRFPKDCWGKNCPHFHAVDMSIDDLLCACDILQAKCDARARFVQQYFRKGRVAVVEGRLQVRDYTGRDGSKRRAVEVVADSVYFGDSKPEPPSEGNADESALPASQGGEFAELDDDGELPF